MIITLTGASGSGKTTIAKKIMERLPNAHPLTSHTTRSPRPTDQRHDFEYLDTKTFDEMKERGEFLWTAQVADTRYGTSMSLLQKALEDEACIWIMLLVPEVLPTLYEFARTSHTHDSLTSFFIQVPDEDTLRERMKRRGDADEQIEKRIEACHDFESKADASDIPYIKIDNSGELDDAVDAIIAKIETNQ